MFDPKELHDMTEEKYKSIKKIKGYKEDREKPRWDLLPFKSIKKLVDVLTLGEKKYSKDNWKYVDDANQRYFAAAMRHLTSWWEGEKKDPETNLSHLAHVGCCILFLLWFEDKEDK